MLLHNHFVWFSVIVIKLVQEDSMASYLFLFTGINPSAPILLPKNGDFLLIFFLFLEADPDFDIDQRETGQWERRSEGERERKSEWGCLWEGQRLLPLQIKPVVHFELHDVISSLEFSLFFPSLRRFNHDWFYRRSSLFLSRLLL